MCEFLSFCVDKAGNVYVGRLDSHAGIEAGHGLQPGSYREAEWTGDGPDSLTVRVESDEKPSFYQALILGRWATRTELLAWIETGRADNAVYHYRCGERHREDGPAYERGDYHAWYWAGELHREDGPAIEDGDRRAWYWAGQLHRGDTGGRR